MGKILVIAEKPSVGRDIARVLGCKGRGEGFLYSDTYVVSWAIGHLVTLCEPEDYNDEWKSWRLATLPIIPERMELKAVAATKKQLAVLKKLMNAKDTDSLICATDSGREGELIFRYIYTLCKCQKPFQRLWISSMTDAAITDGFRGLKDGGCYDNLYHSAKCRSEADWLVGMNATRAYTIRHGTLLSVGRVQTPTLAILAARQREIDAFVPKDYWEVRAAFVADGNTYTGVWFEQQKDTEARESKIFDREKAEAVRAKVAGKIGIPSAGVVAEIEHEEKKQLPGQLYDLTELQRDCNKKFGYPAQKTLTLAQSLYEKRKMITYPRTDSRYLSEDMVPKLPGLLRKLAATEYGVYAETVLGLEKLPVTKRIVDNAKVTDHHAIIPTENIRLAALSADERNVYDLVVRKFIGVFYPPYRYNLTRLITRVEDELFLSKGTTVVALGFMALYRDELKQETDDRLPDEGRLPDIEKGTAVAVTDCEVNQKQTQPPKPYTEAALLSSMENAGRFVEDGALKEQLKASGLGTPATRAAIIERLLAVGYAERRGKVLAPTAKGMKLIEVVPPELKSPETTGKWEKGLQSIAEGRMDEQRFMGSITRYVAYIIEQSQMPTAVVFEKEGGKPRRGGKSWHTKGSARKKNGNSG